MSEQNPHLTDEEQQAFRDIADGISDESFNKLLNHDLTKVQMWLRKCKRDGYRPSLTDLVKQMMYDRSSRPRIIAAYSAALWRLAHKREENIRDARRRSGESEGT